MIKRPREVNKIINKLTNDGYEVYCAGQCVTASYVGDEPQDWDLYTDCPQDKIREAFPEGEALGKRVTRLDYTNEIISQDINEADRLEGIVADVVTLDGTMEEQLSVYDLSVEAIAEHPQRTPIDPYGGREDIKNLIIKPVGDIEASFRKDPMKIFKVIRYVAMYNFDLTKELSEIIMEHSKLLYEVDDEMKENILYDFSVIINSQYAGKALKMIAALGLIPAIVGEAAATTGRREVQTYETFADNIHKMKQIPLRRIALFYQCFDRHYQQAVEYLPHQGLDREYLLEAKTLLRKIYFLGNDAAIKGFVCKCGWDKYNFIDKLSKAEGIVFDLNTMKIEGRDYMLREMLKAKQPIFEEDLVIDAEDIIEAGITDSPEQAQYLMSLLPDVVHQKPQFNERKTLLKHAKQFNKNKLRKVLRDVKWLR